MRPIQYIQFQQLRRLRSPHLPENHEIYDSTRQKVKYPQRNFLIIILNLNCSVLCVLFFEFCVISFKMTGNNHESTHKTTTRLVNNSQNSEKEATESCVQQFY